MEWLCWTSSMTSIYTQAVALRKATLEFQLTFIYPDWRWWPLIVLFVEGKFAFGIYDFDGNDTMDAFFLGDCLRALDLNPTNAYIEKMGGTKKKGNSHFRLIQSIRSFDVNETDLSDRWEEVQTGWVLAHLQWRQEKQRYGNLRRFHGVHEVVWQIWKRPHDRSWVVPHPCLFGSVFIYFHWRIITIIVFVDFLFSAAGERLTEQEADEIMKDCGCEENEDGEIQYSRMFLLLSWHFCRGVSHRWYCPPEYLSWNTNQDEGTTGGPIASCQRCQSC